jgi:hypothetical protein
MGFGKVFMKNTCVFRSPSVDPRLGESPFTIWKHFLNVLDHLRDHIGDTKSLAESAEALKLDSMNFGVVKAIYEEAEVQGPRFTFLRKGVKDKSS